ncbi:hypothetical protein FHG87_018568 [Trinorchestia longiramus]|nr:hypothetical protein FHG87_018568 [Trinorchestia longiramus]
MSGLLHGGSNPHQRAKNWRNPSGGFRGSGAPLSTATVFSIWRRHQHEWHRYHLSHPDPSTIESLLLRSGVHLALPPRAHIPLPFSVLCAPAGILRMESHSCVPPAITGSTCAALASLRLLPTPLPGVVRPAMVYPRPLPRGEPETPHPTNPIFSLPPTPAPNPSPPRSPPPLPTPSPIPLLPTHSPYYNITTTVSSIALLNSPTACPLTPSS